MKSKKKAVIFTVLALLWTVVIFSFSLQPAEASASLSGGLLKRLLDWFHAITGLQIPPSFAHFLIRKTAHFGEFFLLGVFSYHASKHWFGKWVPALCYGALIAVSDELIQHFTGHGRAMRIADMLLDTAGVFAAILVILGISKSVAARKHKYTEKE